MANPRKKNWLDQLRDTIRDTFQNITDEFLDMFDERPSYIQMRLPVDNITDELEENLKEKIENNIIQAKIREATKEDIKKLVEIYNQSWSSTPMPIRNANEEHFLKIFKVPNTVFLMANVDSINAGFILVHSEGKEHEIGIIGGFGVLPEYQYKGLGTMLAMAAWNYFKENGAKELRCEIHKANKVIYKFIKRLGFKEYGGEDII
jgi:ribosomal protein S18 acetylase RimI-like enzyme